MNTRFRRGAELEVPGPLIRFSADLPLAPVDAAALPVNEIRSIDSYLETPAQDSLHATETTTKELRFFDANVAGYEELAADARAHNSATRAIEVVVIGQDEDGLALIWHTFAERSDISAVHVISHATDRVVQLDSSRVLSTPTWSTEMLVASAIQFDSVKEAVPEWQTGWNRQTPTLPSAADGNSGSLFGRDAGEADQLPPACEQEFVGTELHFTSAKLNSALAAAGVVWWAGRAGALLAGLASSNAALSRFDPLPVVGNHDDENDPEVDSHDPGERAKFKQAAFAKLMAEVAAVPALGTNTGKV
jgi:Domain of unknown function (DUF4347)